MTAAFVAMLLVSGASGVSGTGVTDPLGTYRGLPVLSVDIEGPSEEESTDELRSLIEIEPGYLLATADIEVAIARLYALGRFSAVRVYAERYAGAVALHFYLRVTRSLARLDVIGVQVANKGEITSALQIRPGDEIDRRTTERLRERALVHLRRVGFSQATVNVREVSDPGRRTAALVVEVVEGQPERVVAVHFEGDLRVAGEYLMPALQLREGAVFDQRLLRTDREALVRQYRRKGFMRARVDEPTVSHGPHGAVVTYRVEASRRIDVALSGNRLIPGPRLADLSPQTGEPLRDGDLRVWASRIVDQYQRLGYPDAKVHVRGFLDAANDIVRYHLRIDEGRSVRVSEIRFAGARAIRETVMRQQVEARLRDGLASDSMFVRLAGDDLAAVWGSAGTTNAPQMQPSGALTAVPPEARWVPGIYQQALDEITQVYRGLGYLSASVGPAKTERLGDTLRVTVPVIEGAQTFVHSVAFHDNEAFTSERGLETIAGTPSDGLPTHGIALGGPFSHAALEDSRIALVRRYRDEGYLYARVFTRVQLSDDRTQANVAYDFEEGPQVRVQRILIKGNRYTREEMIRSRVRFAEGDVYRLENALAAQRDIAGLGVFSSVRVKLLDEERPSERKDLVAEVVERDRQPVELAWGISTADGPRLQLSYAHLNVGGLASTFASSAKVNRQVFFGLYGPYAEVLRRRYGEFTLSQQVERELRASIRSPRALTLPLDPSVRLDLVNEHDNTLPYSLTTSAAIVGIDLRVSDRVALLLEPQISLTELVCGSLGDGTGANCENEVQTSGQRRFVIQQGTQRTVKIGPTLTWDHRDSPFAPRRGWLARARATYAVGLSQTPATGATSDAFAFVKADTQLTGYVPIAKAVLALSAQGGVLRRLDRAVVPVDERFYLGGRDTLRGFVERSLLPDDACVILPGVTAPPPSWCHEGILVTDAATVPVSQGGDVMALLKAELRLPMAENLSLALFADAGNLWAVTPKLANVTLRIGTGVGLRYATPVGALSLDLGINPGRRASNAEPLTQVHFSVGSF